MSAINTDSLQNLRTKIKSIQFGMLTTLNGDQSLSSRPMTQQQLDEHGVLWFFISDTSLLARDLNQHPNINVTFAEPKDNVYVSISGKAEVVKNLAKATELWSPAIASWFPEGISDPHLSLIKFTIHTAEYWDSHSNKMLQLFAIAKAVINGEQPKDIGEHEKLNF